MEQRKMEEDWRRQRWHTYFMLKSNPFASTEISSPEELMPLPGDVVPEKKVKITDEQREAIFKKWEKKPPGQGRPITKQDIQKMKNG